MSASVNLLPPEIEVRRRTRRLAVLTAGGVGIYVAALGLLYALKLGDVRQAEQARDQAGQQVAALQADLAQLQQFQTLNDELIARNSLLAGAMDTEVSFARTLNDLALSFPATASLRTLQLQLQQTGPVGAAPAAEPGAVNLGDAIGTLTFEGYSIERYAPGVESVLLELGGVRSFFNSYLSGAGRESIEETPVVNFSGTVQLDAQAYTQRYENGLPEEPA